MARYNDLRGRALLFLLFFWFLWLMNIGARTLFAPILPVLEDEFVVNHARASTIFIFQAVGYGLSMFFSGFYAGRFGLKRSITVSLTVSGLVFFAVPFVHHFPVLYLLSFILGVSIGIYLPSALPLITESFSEKDWGKSIAIHDSGASIAIFVIPFVALFFLHFFTWRSMFVALAVGFIIVAAIFWSVVDEVHIRHSGRATLGDLLRSRSLWVMNILFAFAAAANLGIYSIVPLYLTKELSMSIGYANSVLGISRLGSIGIAVAAGFVIDRVRLRETLFVTLFASGVLTVVTGAVGAGGVGLFLFVQTVVVSAFFPVGLVSMAKMATREARGMATGFVLCLSVIFGAGIAPYLLGLSGDLISFRFGIITLGVLTALGSGLALSLRDLK